MKKSPMRHFSFSKKTPDNISTTKNRLLEFKPEELAQQLTLMDFEFFSALDTREFLELSWMKSDKEEKAPTILKLTRWTNKVAFWIVSEILSCSNLRQRSQALEACITIVQV